MRLGRLGLRSRLVAVTVIAGVVAAVLGAVVQTASTRAALLDEITSRNAALATELAARLDSRIELQVSTVESIGGRQEISSLGPRAGSELRAAVAASRDVDEMVLFDASGRPIAAAASRFVASPADEPPRPDILAAVAEAPLVKLVDRDPLMLEVAVAVENPPGTVVGGLLGRLPLEVAVGPALRQDPAFDTTRFMVDGAGQIVVHPERDRVLRRETVPLERVLAESDGVASVEVDGATHLLAAVRLDLADAAVVIEQRESVALAPVGDQLREITLILALVMAATVLAVSVAGTWLLRPLRPLATAVRRLGHRETGVRVDERSHGEVRLLAQEFNRLAQVLDQRREEIDEVQRLSLLVTSRTNRSEVASEIAQGAARLLHVESAAFCSAGTGSLDIDATHGVVPAGAALECAATALRVQRPHADDFGDDRVAAVPVRTREGEAVGALVVARKERSFAPDEIELVETYGAFAGVAFENVGRLELEQQLATELAEAVEQRRSLLGTVSHEFRTPLTCIDGFSTMLLERWDAYDESQRRDLVAKIKRNGQELDDLVSRVLDFAVTERGTLTASMVPVRLDTFVPTVIETMEPLLEGRRVDVDIPEIAVSADPVMLHRMLSNLVSNAVKYSRPGSPVIIRAVDDGTRVRLEVIDEGVGLTADEAARAFQPFWRASNPDTRSERGAGLGLALVAEYARAMGGAPGVVSEPGYGSTFFVTLERAAAG